MRTIQQVLSEPRLKPYVEATDGSEAQTLALYAWNSQCGAAFLESLHYVEVGLRNAVDSAIQTNIADPEDLGSWLSCGRILDRLSSESQKQVEFAPQRIRRNARLVTHDRVVAELSFGFWWSLLESRYNRSLWQPALQFAFEGEVRRQRLHDELNHLRLLRNRIAHHEPLFHRMLEDDWRRLLDVSQRIATSLEKQLETTTRVPDVLIARPFD